MMKRRAQGANRLKAGSTLVAQVEEPPYHRYVSVEAPIIETRTPDIERDRVFPLPSSRAPIVGRKLMRIHLTSSDGEIAACFPVMHRLRPRVASLLLAALASIASGAGAETYLDIPGTRVSLVAPEKFELARDFAELATLDAGLPAHEKKNVAMLAAFRPWIFSMFQGLRGRPLSQSKS